MNILERKSLINMNTELLRFVKDVEKVESVFRYLVKLNKPPIEYYISNDAINTLYTISVDSKLYNNPIKRFKIQDDILTQYGFRPLASGTNRRAFYSEKDPDIILKIASDMVGRSDNIDEYNVQYTLMPFCTKLFSVHQTGIVALSERVETMTEKDYREIWLDEIFDTLQNFYDLGYMFDDVGLYSFKNLGVRLGFGPVLLDFPYVYKIDWKKLRCERIDPCTHEKCGGEIGYNYDAAMSEIICYKCGVRYTAKSLINKHKNESLKIGRNLLMSRKFNFDIPIQVVRGNQIILDSTKPNLSQPKVSNNNNQTIPQQPTTNDTMHIPFPVNNNQQPSNSASIQMNSPQPTVSYMPPQQQPPLPPMQQMPMYQSNPINGFMRYSTQYAAPPIYPPVDVPRDKVEKNGNMLVTMTPEEFIALKAQYSNSGQLPVTIVAPPEIKDNMMQNKEEPHHSTPIKTIGTVKEFEHYYVSDSNGNSKRLFYYPKDLKNEIITWLKKLEETYGKDIALMFARRLEIEYIPKDEWANNTKNRTSSREINNNIRTSSPYQTINTINRAPQNEIIIAPPTKQSQLQVEDPTYWDKIRQTFAEDEAKSEQIITATPDDRPTTGLYVMKPLSQEEYDAQEQKKRAEEGILGFVGTPAVETVKFNEAMSRIKTMVEQRFDGVPLSADSEKQINQLVNNIRKFIAPDVQHVMNDDGKGLEVFVKRITDHQNKDCFSVEATNYKTPLFVTVIYPQENSNKYDDEMTDVTTEELTQFFEKALKKFDPSQFTGLEEVKKALICFLCDASYTMFKDRRLTVPAALKEATAYVNQVVNFTPNKESKNDNNNKTNTTIADTL